MSSLDHGRNMHYSLDVRVDEGWKEEEELSLVEMMVDSKCFEGA